VLCISVLLAAIDNTIANVATYLPQAPFLRRLR
jgi:hypothetical protein